MWLKQSTAFTEIVGPILDSAGAEYTGAVIGDLSISKNGTEAAMAAAATLTHVSNGYYTLVGTTGNADTLGRVTIRCNKSTYQMPPHHYVVLPATVFDALVTNAAGGANGLLLSDANNRVDLGKWIGTAPLALSSQQVQAIVPDTQKVDLNTIKTNPVVNAGTLTFPTNATLASTTNITAGTLTTVTTATNVTTVNGLAAGVITANAIAADAITDAKVASDVTIASVTGAVGSVTGNVGGNVVGSVASVTAGVTVTTNNDKTGYALSSAGVQAIWDALTSALTTVGSIGKRIVDYLTGDAYARLGAPAGVSVSADIAAVQSDTDNIQTRIPAALTADGNIKADTLRVNGAAQTAGDLAALITTVDDLLDTEMPALTAAVAALPTAATNAAALLDLTDGIETSITPRSALKLILAAAAGKLSGAGGTTVTIRNVGDSVNRITATVDSSGNRSAVTTNVT